MRIVRISIGTMLAVAALALLLSYAAPFTGSRAARATPATAATPESTAEISPVFPQGEPAPPGIGATAAILIDVDSGRILFSHNANARLPMASTTKIMTALVAMEALPLDREIRISAAAAAEPGSKLWLQTGEVLTAEQLLYALLVFSANDAAVALAEAAAGSVPAFVERMNERAKELGLKNTHFRNANGLNADKHFSSAKDLADLAMYAMDEPLFSRIVSTREYLIPRPGEEEPFKLENHNVLLKEQAWVTGVKTGSTPYAKYCLVASGTRDGVSLIAVLLGSADDETRWKEARALFDYGFHLYPRTVLADTGEPVMELAAQDYLGRKISLVAERAFVVSLGKDETVTRSIRVSDEAVLPVRVGDVFGEMDFIKDGVRIGSVRLVAAQTVERADIKMILDRWSAASPSSLALAASESHSSF